MTLVVKNMPGNAGNTREVSLIPGLGTSPGAGHDNPFQENPMDRDAGGLQSMESQKVEND